jgi:ABC-2 type transport system ATP-binding protein
LIRVEHLTKTFGEYPALDNIDFEVQPGSVFGLVGPNGAGKTTLIKTIMGILLPDRGRVLIDGHDVHRNPGIKARVGYVADDQGFYPHFKVRDMIKFYRNTYVNWDEKRFQELWQLFPLPEGKRVRHLSKGMRTRLAVLLNLSIAPAVLVLDEPTSGLDPVLRRQLLNILVDEVAHRQTTILISTHNLNELERICDRIGIIHNGRVLFNESLEEMKQNVRKIQVAVNEPLPEEFLKQANILKVERRGRVYTIVVRENPGGVMAELERYRPLLLETIDMSLEDIFIYRMGGMGYGLEQTIAQ